MTTVTTVNVELGDAVIDYLAAHPEEHYQGVWGERSACGGTRLCMAGHVAVTFQHATPIWEPLAADDVLEGFDLVFVGPHGDGSSDMRSVFGYAVEQLGVTEGQGSALFLDCETLGELVAVWEAIKADPGIGQPDLANTRYWAMCNADLIFGATNH